jgi:hypothetical protein
MPARDAGQLERLELVAAGFAAGLAIIKTVLAKLDVEERLAEAAELFAGAAIFGHFTLHAAVFLRLVGSGSHERSVTLAGVGGKVTIVH